MSLQNKFKQKTDINKRFVTEIIICIIYIFYIYIYMHLIKLFFLFVGFFLYHDVIFNTLV